MMLYLNGISRDEIFVRQKSVEGHCFPLPGCKTKKYNCILYTKVTSQNPTPWKLNGVTAALNA